MLKIKVYKEKQYLVFDFENGKTVKYDFATKTAIGLKGKPVKDLKTQLRGITIGEIIESCEDENIKNFYRSCAEDIIITYVMLELFFLKFQRMQDLNSCFLPG